MSVFLTSNLLFIPDICNIPIPAMHDGGGEGNLTHGLSLRVLHGDLHVRQLHRKVTDDVIQTYRSVFNKL